MGVLEQALRTINRQQPLRDSTVERAGVILPEE